MQFINKHKFSRYFVLPHFFSFSPSSSSSSSSSTLLDSLDHRPSYVPKPLHFSTGLLDSDYRITDPHLLLFSFQSSSRYSSTFTHPLLDIRFLNPRRRLFSISSPSNNVFSFPAKFIKRHPLRGKRFNSKLTVKEITEIVDAIKLHAGTGITTLDCQLNMVFQRLSIDCLIAIFNVLNGQRVSGLPLFTWVSSRKPDLYRNSHFCSLVIDNCGWLGDYETMATILIDFKSKNLCLTSKAFSFLPVLRRSSNHSLLGESITKVIQVLDKVGGSCRSSGIVGLITMLCELEAFEMADFVMNITERKTQYFKVVIREKCKKCYFEEARKTLKEMRDFLCEPDVKIYNYLLSTLCKNRKLAEAHSVFEEMKNNGYPPDSLTFDIFIHFTARHGMLVAATEFLNEMINMGLEPRISTHAAIIKGFLLSGGRLEEVYEEEEYGSINSSEVVGDEYHHHQTHFNSSNMIYCLLAGFHQQKGDIVRATNILIKMMGKGLRPNLSIYRRVLNQLKKDCHDDLARDLKNRFSSLEELVSSCAVIS